MATRLCPADGAYAGEADRKYVEVYEKKTEADIIVKSTYKRGDAIIVTIDTKVGTEAFKDALALYDIDGNYIETVNAVDSTKKIVTIITYFFLTSLCCFKCIT